MVLTLTALVSKQGTSFNFKKAKRPIGIVVRNVDNVIKDEKLIFFCCRFSTFLFENHNFSFFRVNV